MHKRPVSNINQDYRNKKTNAATSTMTKIRRWHCERWKQVTCLGFDPGPEWEVRRMTGERFRGRSFPKQRGTKEPGRQEKPEEKS